MNVEWKRVHAEARGVKPVAAVTWFGKRTGRLGSSGVDSREGSRQCRISAAELVKLVMTNLQQ